MLEKYADMIVSNTIREEVYSLLEQQPDKLWYLPASSTGKYHSKDATILTHTERVIKVCLQLRDLEWWCFSEEDKDVVLASCIVHDFMKYGSDANSKHTLKNHDVLMAKQIMNDSVSEHVLKHMGEWGEGDIHMTVSEFFVHLCDFIGSRSSAL
jgi:hypothetical protein